MPYGVVNILAVSRLIRIKLNLAVDKHIEHDRSVHLEPTWEALNGWKLLSILYNDASVTIHNGRFRLHIGTTPIAFYFQKRQQLSVLEFNRSPCEVDEFREIDLNVDLKLLDSKDYSYLKQYKSNLSVTRQNAAPDYRTVLNVIKLVVRGRDGSFCPRILVSMGTGMDYVISENDLPSGLIVEQGPVNWFGAYLE